MAVHDRTNLTVRQQAPLFGVSPAAALRVAQRLRPPPALGRAPPPVADRGAGGGAARTALG
ncbi:hypothetical protein GCM10017667_43290 [Streptomyces filamentosus]|uniref:Transposase n=1 Tax=Streptomyces filamentosus TaxID=67294 RepID=A0A919EPN5_STRFL|nr:hypothetical protein GCM10017667_43290 [Streptomyces filamentosus]